MAGRLYLLVGGLIVGLIAAELVLRLQGTTNPLEQALDAHLARASDFRALHELRPDRPWLYGLRPGVQVEVHGFGAARYTINADGFRGRHHPRPKPPGTFRIVVLGDSVAFGFGVDDGDTFPEQLERLLAARAEGTAVDVVNLAVSGYNPYTEAALLADVGVTYAPDVVIVQFSPNDLAPPAAHFNSATRVALGALPPEAFPDPAQRRPFRAAMVEWCRALRTCALLDDRLLGWSLSLLSTPPAGEDAVRGWLWARYSAMAGTAAADHARFAVVLFPTRRQVEGRMSRPEEQVAVAGRDAGWLVADLLPVFRGAAGDTDVYLPDDPWHPSPAGHRLAAATILEALACARFVPAPPAGDCPAPTR